jgi:membrane protein implicated in regulation of membrane protease activity
MFGIMIFGWADFFLLLFLVGLGLSVVTLFAGAFRIHLPGHAHFHLGHVGHGHGGFVKGGTLSPLNLPTLITFATWFGGVGYLMTSVYRLWLLPALIIATLAGFVGGAIVFWFLLKMMLNYDHTLDPADFEIVGVIGTITNSIREGGTGEITYSQGGTRRATAARADGGAAIARGTEVAVTRYEKGIAYVRPWDELAEGNTSAATANRDSEMKE